VIQSAAAGIGQSPGPDEPAEPEEPDEPDEPDEPAEPEDPEGPGSPPEPGAEPPAAPPSDFGLAAAPSAVEDLGDASPPASAFAADLAAEAAPRSFFAQPLPLNTTAGAAMAFFKVCE
jgi:hypothetical protein